MAGTDSAFIYPTECCILTILGWLMSDVVAFWILMATLLFMLDHRQIEY